jgi:hypothetical protein
VSTLEIILVLLLTTLAGAGFYVLWKEFPAIEAEVVRDDDDDDDVRP